jgi:hypothetical protein
MQLVKQNLPIPPNEDNFIVLDPFHVNDGFAGLVDWVELNFFLDQVSVP